MNFRFHRDSFAVSEPVRDLDDQREYVSWTDDHGRPGSLIRYHE
jgi:hypothetical protein